MSDTATPVSGSRREPTDRFGLLLVLVLTSIAFTGVGADIWRVVAGVVNVLLLLVAIRSTGLGSSGVRLASAATVGLCAVVVLAVFEPLDRPGGIAGLLQVAILLVIILAIGRRLVHHERVSLQTVAGSLCMYALIGLLFSWIYGSLSAFYDAPVLTASSGRADPVYYSYVVLTTVGFGDVTSSIDIVRRISVLEAMIGQIVLVTMVARLVSLYGTDRRVGSAPPANRG